MTKQEIQRVAELSRLQFTDEQLDAFIADFSRCVDYVGTIAKVDMSDVEPMASVNDTNNDFREDLVGDCLTTEEALRNAPKKNDAFFKVPKVLG